MSTKPCCTGEGLKKGAWSVEEDKTLISYIHEHGEGGWRDIPAKAGLKRCGKSCRLRWANYLKPDIKRGEFSYEEEQIIMLHASRGNKWSVIARHLPKRTDNEIKNYWNTHLKKRLIDKGIDPVTHMPLASSNLKPTTEPNKFHSQEEFNRYEHSSQSSSTSPISLPVSSSFKSTIPEIRSDETPLESGFLSCKKRFESSSSTSRLLNKVAARASSIGKILSTSIEGTLSSPSSSSCHPNSLSQSSEQMIDNKEDLSTSIDLNIPEYDLSKFLEQFISEDEAESIGGYNQNLLMSDVPSTLVDEENMVRDMTGWSIYDIDDPNFMYEFEAEQD